MNTGDRIHVRNAPGNTGTVSRVVPGLRFRVTWDDPGRPKGRPRARHWYPDSYRPHFAPGNPAPPARG